MRVKAAAKRDTMKRVKQNRSKVKVQTEKRCDMKRAKHEKRCSMKRVHIRYSMKTLQHEKWRDMKSAPRKKLMMKTL